MRITILPFALLLVSACQDAPDEYDPDGIIAKAESEVAAERAAGTLETVEDKHRAKVREEQDYKELCAKDPGSIYC